MQNSNKKKSLLIIIFIASILFIIAAVLQFTGVVELGIFNSIKQADEIQLNEQSQNNYNQSIKILYDDNASEHSITVYDEYGVKIRLREKQAWAEQQVEVNGEILTLCSDTVDFDFMYDMEQISNLSRVKDVAKIEIEGTYENSLLFDVFGLNDEPIDYAMENLISSGSELILPQQDGEYLVVITVVWTQNRDRNCMKYYFLYTYKPGEAQGEGSVLVYDADGEMVPIHSEFMWSATATTLSDGTKSYLSADAGQLGFMKKDELVSGFAETKSVGEIKVTKEPWSEPMYTVYDLSYPLESINLVGANDDSVFHYGKDLVLPEAEGEYIVAVTVVWDIKNGRSATKYFFKYIVE